MRKLHLFSIACGTGTRNVMLLASLFLGQVHLFANESGFNGDGRFTDRGVDVAAERYLLDLGRVNLNQDGEYEFKFSGLPAVRFNAQILLGMQHYFNVRPRPAEDMPRWFKDVHIVLRVMKDGDDEAVIEFDGKLSQLTWTNGSPKSNTSALYARGGRSHDNGSLFVADAKAKYTLSLTVQSDASEAVAADLVLSGGGWKLHPVNEDQLFNDLFANADRNNDRQLSATEIPREWRKSWATFDADGNGLLSHAEAKALRTSMSPAHRSSASSFLFRWLSK